MPRKTEPKRPVGIPESTFKEIEKYAIEHNLFIYEVILLSWENFKIKKVTDESQQKGV